MRVFIFDITCNDCKSVFIYKATEYIYKQKKTEHILCKWCNIINYINLTDLDYKISNIS